MGYDLRAVCRELSRVVRDLLVVSVDASRAVDPEIAGEGERDRIKDLASRFSREDLLRAFDLLTKAESDIRTAAQPRHHLEMALLRWIYLRKLVSIEDLIAGAPAASKSPVVSGPSASSSRTPQLPAPQAPQVSKAPQAREASQAPGSVKDALLAEIRKQKVVFYNTVVAQAQKIDVADDRVTFTFSPNHRTLRSAFDEKKGWLESVGQQALGRKIAIVSVQADAKGGSSASTSAAGAASADKPQPDKKAALRDQAMADAGIQSMLEIFPAEIRDVEEM